MKLISRRTGIIAGVIAGVLILAIAVLPIAAHMMMPEVRLVNQGDTPILDAVVELPSSKVSFGSVSPGASATVYYGARQEPEGVYRYTLRLASGEKIEGSCGNVANSEYGKRVIILMDLTESVSCDAEYKF